MTEGWGRPSGPKLAIGGAASSDRRGPPSSSPVITPEFLVNTAKKSVPSFRWVVAAAATLALAATVLQWGASLQSLVVAAAVLLFGAVALMTLQWIAKLKPKDSSTLAVVAAWTFMGTIIVSVVLGLTSAAADTPWPLRSYIADLLRPGRGAIDEAKPPRPSESLGAFVSEIEFEADAVKRIQYSFAPNVVIPPQPDDFLKLTQLSWGRIGSTERGYRAVFTYRNTTGGRLTLSVRPEYFALRNNHGAEAVRVDFRGPPSGDTVGDQQERTVTVLFKTTSWHAKESGVTKVYFEVLNFLPLYRGVWEARPPAAAAQ